MAQHTQGKIHIHSALKSGSTLFLTPESCLGGIDILVSLNRTRGGPKKRHLLLWNFSVPLGLEH
jgi:hypothetical protein